MDDWIPALSTGDAPQYLSIVNAIEADIKSGRLPVGARLLPHREMAKKLGLSPGTVSKAYAEAARRGLVSAEIGRGTFVQPKQSPAASNATIRSDVINLSFNVPCPTGDDLILAQTITELVSDGLGELLSYLPHQGRRDHREAGAMWLDELGWRVDPDRIFICNGAQHGLALAANILASAGDVVLAEALTYSGIVALAAHAKYRLRGVSIDSEGIVPAALDSAFKETGARVLYAMPNLQTPTGTILSRNRREQIADILRKHDAYIIEDDVFSFLFPKTPSPISAFAPERSFYLTSFAKCVAPGLRVGAVIAPPEFRDRFVNGLRSTGWMATPIMVEATARLIRNGQLARLAAAKREQAAIRHAMARKVFGPILSRPPEHPAFHIWLPLPPGRAPTELAAAAAVRGVQIAPPNVLPSPDPVHSGVRICLGCTDALDRLRQGLETIRQLVVDGEAISQI